MTFRDGRLMVTLKPIAIKLLYTSRNKANLFLTDGMIAYCSDNPHALNGQTVPLPDFPDGYSY